MFPADTVYGLACDPDSRRGRAAVRAQGPPAGQAGGGDVLRPRARLRRAARARAAHARALERLLPGASPRCCRTRSAASRSPAGPSRTRSVCACRRCPVGALAAMRGPCCRARRTVAGGPTRAARRRPGGDPRAAPTWCSTAASCRDAVDGRRPAPLRGSTGGGRVLRQGAVPARRSSGRRCRSPRPAVRSWARSSLETRHDRPAARLLRAPPRRRRPRGRRGPRRRARAPAADAGDDRVGELRAAGRPRVPGQRAHQQVRRGLPGQALLRRLRARRRHRAARDRPREGAVRRRARQRPAARRRAGQRGRLPRAAAAGRHDHGPRARRTAATSRTA